MCYAVHVHIVFIYTKPASKQFMNRGHSWFTISENRDASSFALRTSAVCSDILGLQALANATHRHTDEALKLRKIENINTQSGGFDSWRALLLLLRRRMMRREQSPPRVATHVRGRFHFSGAAMAAGQIGAGAGGVLYMCLHILSTDTISTTLSSPGGRCSLITAMCGTCSCGHMPWLTRNL